MSLPAGERKTDNGGYFKFFSIMLLIYTLYFASDILIPFFIALLLWLALAPVMDLMRRIGMPAVMAAAILVFTSIAVVGAGLLGLAIPVQQWIKKLPQNAVQIRAQAKDWQKLFEPMTNTAKELESITSPDTGAVAEVVVREGSLMGDMLLGGGDVLMTLVLSLILLFFFLAYAERLLEEITAWLKSISVFEDPRTLVDRIEKNISHYLFAIAAINVALGIVEGFAMYLLGLPDPLLWGVLACLANFVPYLGAVAGSLIVFLAALSAFPTVAAALGVALVFYAISVIEGSLITPLILGRVLTINPVVVVSWVLVWTWMWGVYGAILAVPILLCGIIFEESLFPKKQSQLVNALNEKGQSEIQTDAAVPAK